MELESPAQRKRPRSNASTSPSPSRDIKRMFIDELAPSSPKAVRFDYANDGDQMALESYVPDSPIGTTSCENSFARVSFKPLTPLTPRTKELATTQISDSLAKLELKPFTHKRNLATPVAARMGLDEPKSVRKSARKTPSSPKTNKALPFQLKVNRYSLSHLVSLLPQP